MSMITDPALGTFVHLRLSFVLVYMFVVCFLSDPIKVIRTQVERRSYSYPLKILVTLVCSTVHMRFEIWC